MFLNELTWYQFSNLPNISKLPQHEQERQYRIYINEVTMQRFAMIQEELSRAEAIAVAAAASSGGGGVIQQESELPSSCIQFVNNTTDGTDCQFWINTSAPTNYTITWGDGETETGEVNGVDQLELNHDYADLNTEYTVRLCFDDISVVTRLEFNGDD
jgi:hypothetical protein